MKQKHTNQLYPGAGVWGGVPPIMYMALERAAERQRSCLRRPLCGLGPYGAVPPIMYIHHLGIIHALKYPTPYGNSECCDSMPKRGCLPEFTRPEREHAGMQAAYKTISTMDLGEKAFIHSFLSFTLLPCFPTTS
jgi:hypothetical protein